MGGLAGDEVFVVTQDTGQASPSSTAQALGSSRALAPTRGINMWISGLDRGYADTAGSHVFNNIGTICIDAHAASTCPSQTPPPAFSESTALFIILVGHQLQGVWHRHTRDPDMHI